jgi:4-amino-4-deoxy-L-arabinose transferase-like glycosyltransferase
VELRHVEHVHLAHQMRRQTQLFAALLLLCALRLVAGAVLPLTSDEAYYWLWSRHLAAGYYDHPPAIAFLIRAGTVLFGDTALGVRLGGILLSFAATWFVWRTGALLISEKAAALAALFFNLSLMLTVEGLAATPDAPSLALAAAFAWTLAKLVETNDGRWWLAVGAAAGLGLLSKYSALFLGAGVLLWLTACPSQRRWFLSPWPYLGGLLALVIFAPNLIWNAQHGWATFIFQFGRVGSTHYTLRYLGEFIGAQALLATPLIFILGLFGLAAASRRDPKHSLLAALLWPALAYFLVHALHDRVQGNWLSFLFPMFAVLAAAAALQLDWSKWRAPLVRWSSRLAVPVAAVLLLAGYAQALFGVVPMGRKDPLARLLAVGFPQVIEHLDTLRGATGGAILTTDYASTAWFAFYGHYPVTAIGEDYRWPNAAAAPASLCAKSCLYVGEIRRDRHDLVAAEFAEVKEIARFDRLRQGVPVAHYIVYRASGPKGAFGRLP